MLQGGSESVRERILWIDAIKGFGIILVMLAHLTSISSSVFWYLCYGFMPIFFVMSGITYKSNEDVKTYIKKKVFRLLIPYFFYGFIIILISGFLDTRINLVESFIGLLYGRWSIYPLDKEDNILMLGNCNAIAPLWFLLNLFLGYILFFIYNKIKWKSIFIVLCIMFSIISSYKTILLPWSLDTCFMTFLFIFTGRKLSILNNNKIKWYYGILSLAIYFLIGKLNGPTNYSVGMYGSLPFVSVMLFFILGILEPLGLSMIFMKINNSTIIKILSIIGKNSLRLMCTHIIFRDLIIYIYPKFAETFTNQVLVVIIIIILNQLLALIISKGTTRFNLLKFI